MTGEMELQPLAAPPPPVYIPATRPCTRARLTSEGVERLATRANDLYLKRRQAPLTAAEGRELAESAQTLEDVLEGRVVSLAPGPGLDRVISRIKDLPVVRELQSTASPWSAQLGECRGFFSHSHYIDERLTKTDDPEHPSLGDFVVGTSLGAVVKEGSRKVHVEDKDALTIEVTPLPDQRKFRVKMEVPPGKESHFGGLISSERLYDGFEEAKEAIEGALKKAKAFPVDNALAVAQMMKAESSSEAAKRWASRFPGGCPTMKKRDAVAAVTGELRTVDMKPVTRYIPFKTSGNPPQYYIAVRKPGEDPKLYKVKVASCPIYLWSKHKKLIAVSVEGDKEEPLSIEDEFAKQEFRLKEIFGAVAVDLAKHS